MLSATMLKTPFHLIQTIDAECATVAEKLTKSAKQIKTKEDSRNVARVSAENETLALADTFFELGKEGVISVEEKSRPEIEIAKTNGLRIDNGFISPYMVNMPDLTVDLGEPYILVTDQLLSSVELSKLGAKAPPAAKPP